MEGYQNKTECAASFWANFRDVLHYLWRGTKVRQFYYINYEGSFFSIGYIIHASIGRIIINLLVVL